MNDVIPMQGFAPHVEHPDTYKVFASAKENDPETLRMAISGADSSNPNMTLERHGFWVASMPRVVYIPSGNYSFSEPLVMNTDTVLIGDAHDPPVIQATGDFRGDALLDGLAASHEPNAGELANTVALKNVILDTTAVEGYRELAALYWGVAQGSHLQNVQIRMAPSPNGTEGHTGIRLGRGSILSLGDVRVENGLNGIWHDGHQSALYKNITFHGNSVGLRVSNGNAVTLLAPTFESVGTCISQTGGSAFVGVVDGESVNSGVAFLSRAADRDNDTARPSLLLDNFHRRNDGQHEPSDTVRIGDRAVLGPVEHVRSFSYGNTVGREPVYGATADETVRRSRAAAPGGRIPVFPPPNYGEVPISELINVKEPDQNGGRNVHGDGRTDDVEALTMVLRYAAEQGKIAYFPFGDYRVSSTLVIPIGSRICGEAWPAISGSGASFADASRPTPVVQVGQAGDVGTAHIQDMRFTVGQVSPGAVILRFHARGAKPGDVGIWNSVVNVGGLRGTPDLVRRCADDADRCRAAYLGMHFARGSSVYAENVWNWVAGRNAENFFAGLAIAAKGGVLVEATDGTWLHGLGSERWWLYQLSLRSASNVVVSMLRTETSFGQGSAARQMAPSPWTPDPDGWGDPDYSWCDGSDGVCRMAVGSYIDGGSDISYYGAASWVFCAGSAGAPCEPGYRCQRHMHYIAQTPRNLQAYGLCSKDTTYALRLGNGIDLEAEGTFQGAGWPNGSDVSRYTT
ncbi:beta-1,3-glucanase precursor [Metarhizium album ARSEF 1941]|uniref:Beta-1,3-glucanase n=1 Tax=Metarhizium album (strain ARSEF 1941) TaxID=1081103 RepID=A0A0B2X6V5_METAS|nr:beta-1,3-glucanase precursor [Metarhizium album ARSEF 1941]KHO01498.1 beta-1,3-glucanase precursor [Metarhizium album ARSEF 1941]